MQMMKYMSSCQEKSLFSKEFETSIYWIGLVYGVKLEAQEVCKIIDDLIHYVYVEGGKATFLDDDIGSMEAYR